jgi:NitT/TauT family transport system substrate-binding protein
MNLKMPAWAAGLVISFLIFSSLPVARLDAQDQRVRLGYPALSLTFLSFFVAKDAGMFKRHGLDVDLVQLAGAVQTSALVAGEIDYLSGITSPLVAAARGLPFKGIMITHDRPLFYLVAGQEIRRMEDLVGKNVAVDRIGTLQDIVARDLIKRRGVSPERVVIIQTGSVSNSVLALGQGSVAAALLSLPNNVIMTQKGFKELASAAELGMRFPSGGIAAREAKLKENSNQVKSVLRALLDSMEFSRKDKSWTVNYIQAKWKLSPKVADEAYGLWLQGFTADGKIPLKDLQEIYNLAYASQMIPTPVQVKSVMDYTPLDEVLRERMGKS